jgi:hypothetical protein
MNSKQLPQNAVLICNEHVNGGLTTQLGCPTIHNNAHEIPRKQSGVTNNVKLRGEVEVLQIRSRPPPVQRISCGQVRDTRTTLIYYRPMGVAGKGPMCCWLLVSPHMPQSMQVWKLKYWASWIH